MQRHGVAKNVNATLYKFMCPLRYIASEPYTKKAIENLLLTGLITSRG